MKSNLKKNEKEIRQQSTDSLIQGTENAQKKSRWRIVIIGGLIIGSIAASYNMRHTLYMKLNRLKRQIVRMSAVVETTHCDQGQMDSGTSDGCVPVAGECATNADCGADEYCAILFEERVFYLGEDRLKNYGGTCVSIVDYEAADIKGLGTVYRSVEPMNWWSARNWCEAQGLGLVDISHNRLSCYGVYGKPFDYQNKQGWRCMPSDVIISYSVEMSDQDIHEELTNEYHSEILAELEKWGGNFWTGTSFNAEEVFYIKGGWLYEISRDEVGLALCE